MSFDPCDRSLKIREFTGTPTPKVGVPFGVWRFIPSHFFAFPGAWNVTPELPFWPALLQALALVASPRLGLWQFWNPNIAMRELLKPKFYDVWFEVFRKNQPFTPNRGRLYDTHVGQTIKNLAINPHSSWLLKKEVSSSIHNVNDCGNDVKMMQWLMNV